MIQKKLGNRLVLGAALLSAAVLTAYAVIYRAAPFSGNWNDVSLGLLSIFGALLAAASAFAVYHAYRPGDTPRTIWRYFMLGVWMWTLSEIAWFVQSMLLNETLTPALADLGWLLGYVFFTIAFIRQYIVLFRTSLRSTLLAASGMWLAAIIVAWLLSWLIGRYTVTAFVEFFYPVGDYMLAILAAHTMWTFRGGALARPWLGLFLFTFADIAYAILAQSDLYSWSAAAGNCLSLAVDLTYLAAYLALSIAFLGQYALLHYAAYSPPQSLES